MQSDKIRRKDRAITDYRQMLAIMRQCDVCRLGFQDEQGVYIVPLNFGIRENDGRITLYFHGFVKGKKIDLIRQQPVVGFEMDRKHEIVHGEIACHYSFLYQCIMGKGKISLVDEPEEKTLGLQCLMQRYTQKTDWIFAENELKKVHVIKLEITQWSCKEH
ncbi:pyridoxamine 5'-phosphate oxidase family protein [Pasteurellaceae bacterium LIM206]|nr:pyridoxamine 5'-phosphate oxidase family protein [Pasteurellaceae bacterium LIM206]